MGDENVPPAAQTETLDFVNGNYTAAYRRLHECLFGESDAGVSDISYKDFGSHQTYFGFNLSPTSPDHFQLMKSGDTQVKNIKDKNMKIKYKDKRMREYVTEKLRCSLISTNLFLTWVFKCTACLSIKEYFRLGTITPLSSTLQTRENGLGATEKNNRKGL